MRAGAAQEEAADRGLVARPIEHRAHGEKLVEGEFAVKNVAAGEAVGGFEISRSDDLHGFDDSAKLGRVVAKVLKTVSPRIAAR